MVDSIVPVKDINLEILDKIMSQWQDFDLNILYTNIIDKVHSSALPFLAEQLHITGLEGWQMAKSEQEQRNLLKNSISIHRYKGTKYALLKVLESLNITGKIEEWFEYDGEPFHFRVNLNLFSRKIDEETENQLIKLINENKNARSILESILLRLATEASIEIITISTTRELITIEMKKNE